jgi:hypothetical protein
MTDDIKSNSEVTESPSPSAAAATKSAENRAVFGPLGKYAVIAVLMVSIIVTTAIMLDKQLSTVEHQIAAFENEVAELHNGQPDTQETAATPATESAITAASTTSPDGGLETVIATEKDTVAEAAVESERVAAADIQTTANVTGAASSDVLAAEFDMNTTADQSANTARLESLRAEQKQRIAEMFERIKALEAQQLDRYKSQQDKQIASLHAQIVQQQKMIEALVLRNENLFELRAANIQRNQANREEILGRI